VRVLRILDTLNVEELYVSQAVVDDLRSRQQLDFVRGASDLFDAHGELTDF
jgi:hypothetical protein